MERTAKQLRSGELEARVPLSLIADKEMRQLAAMFNRLLDTLHNERGRMRDLSARVIAVQDAERARAARELKESAVGHLRAIADEIRAELAKNPREPEAQRLEQLERRATAGIEELRGVAQAVYPDALTQRGLVAALQWLAFTAKQRYGIDVALHTPSGEPNVRGPVAAALYRVAQEAINNAVRHGHAKRLSLTLTMENGSARLTVTDDGSGFDATANGRLQGIAGGLSTSEDRVSLVQGRLVVTSEPGKGTTVEARVPTADLKPLDGVIEPKFADAQPTTGTSQ
jgi:two-component system NarL family sensor kinase